MRVADVAPARLDPSLVDRKERLRAARLARPDDRLSYLAAHALLRQLLAARLGLRPQDVAYLREPCPRCGAPHGRPALDRPSRPLHFSLSRSAGLVLIGIAPTPIGVDVEALPPPETVAEVSALLHAAERREILSAAPSSRAQVFASIWTRKEAYLKGIGIGVTADLAAEHLGGGEQAANPPGWTVISLPVAAGYAAAAAISRPPIAACRAQG
jgi:4'-phosphopantetheinyl transferase